MKHPVQRQPDIFENNDISKMLNFACDYFGFHERRFLTARKPFVVEARDALYFVLNEYKKLNFNEIAEVVGVNAMTVKRGIERLENIVFASNTPINKIEIKMRLERWINSFRNLISDRPIQREHRIIKWMQEKIPSFIPKREHSRLLNELDNSLRSKGFRLSVNRIPDG